MNTNVFFIAALLAPSLAYAANPSADLSVQIVPAEPAPTIPAGAQAAGFKTLAANYDFSQPQYANQSNWLGCYNGSFPSSGFQWYQVGQAPGLNYTTVPCSLIRQVADSTINKNVLDIGWPQSSFVSGTHVNQIIQTQSQDTTSSTDFPPNVYIETMVRTNTDNPSASNGNEIAGFWQWTARHTQAGTNSAIERDIWNIFSLNPTPGASVLQTDWSWGVSGGCSGTACYGGGINPYPNLSQYHKVAVRVTSDGSTAQETCFYFDDVLQECGSEQPKQFAAPFNAFLSRNYLIFQSGDLNGDQDLYVQYVRVWSCATWQTTQCDGQVLTAAP
jgi:hypothetical protein